MASTFLSWYTGNSARASLTGTVLPIITLSKSAGKRKKSAGDVTIDYLLEKLTAFDKVSDV